VVTLVFEVGNGFTHADPNDIAGAEQKRQDGAPAGNVDNVIRRKNI